MATELGCEFMDDNIGDLKSARKDEKALLKDAIEQMQATPEYMQLAPRRQSTELDARASPLTLYCIHHVLNAGPPLGGQPGMAPWRGASAAPTALKFASADSGIEPAPL